MLNQSWEPLCEEVANASTATEAAQILRDIREKHASHADATKELVVFIGRDTRPHSLELMRCVSSGVEAAGGTVLDLGEVTTPLLHFAGSGWTAEALRNHYYATLAEGFLGLCDTVESPPNFAVVLDSSYGIGSQAAVRMGTVLDQLSPGRLEMDIRNQAGQGAVNDGCGAELVQKGLVPPCGVSSEEDKGKMMVSFDGDADRAAGLGDLKLGAVQTAYANGAATNYLRDANVPVLIAKTGVKFVHHAATQFDCGIYFEANGHGTVLFSPELVRQNATGAEERAWLATRRLRLMLLAINQTLSVQNKSLITCSADETTALTPAALPVALAAAMEKVEKGRCFVRPSGTEDVVRVYAEAVDRVSADALADDCIAAVKLALNEV
eukprot:GSChrysophyteH1.ASY1.ANO1.349.1 assembled CDS